jgi:hypothetical protein
MMTKRSCALIGPGHGPRVNLVGTAVVRVNGLGEAESAEVRLYDGHGQLVGHLLVTNDGLHTLPDARFACVKYGGTNRKFLCVILMGRRDALHSD